ncbi:MAG: glycosyltransferase family 4 protein [Thermoleophilia bacterium]|nr:glycosyltransferase family 4 protein [Thermoleophilia bacterium]
MSVMTFALSCGRRAVGALTREARTELDARFRRRGRADLAVFHELEPPPTGGGHQFLRALLGELERRGLRVELNRISTGTPACLFNSFNFDFRRLRRFARPDCRMVHRVDGPLARYRGFDDGTDARIAAINAELADATIVQSRYSLEAHRERGIELREPRLVPNAVDPAIFHPPAQRPSLRGRALRLIATSWSDNPRKGADVLSWLDARLDWERFELTFVGRTSATLRRARVLPPIPSHAVAEELRRHDVYVAASIDDPASNALLEALACGLPALYRRSGGHPEVVGEGGVGFDGPEDVLPALEQLASELAERRGGGRGRGGGGGGGWWWGWGGWASRGRCTSPGRSRRSGGCSPRPAPRSACRRFRR